jgi:hypothetical protein
MWNVNRTDDSGAPMVDQYATTAEGSMQVGSQVGSTPKYQERGSRSPSDILNSIAQLRKSQAQINAGETYEVTPNPIKAQANSDIERAVGELEKEYQSTIGGGANPTDTSQRQAAQYPSGSSFGTFNGRKVVKTPDGKISYVD